MGTAGKTMAAMGKVMDPQKINATMQNFAKENAKMGGLGSTLSLSLSPACMSWHINKKMSPHVRRLKNNSRLN